jgi:hypothetical protein
MLASSSNFNGSGSEDSGSLPRILALSAVLRSRSRKEGTHCGGASMQCGFGSGTYVSSTDCSAPTLAPFTRAPAPRALASRTPALTAPATPAPTAPLPTAVLRSRSRKEPNHCGGTATRCGSGSDVPGSDDSAPTTRLRRLCSDDSAATTRLRLHILRLLLWLYGSDVSGSESSGSDGSGSNGSGSDSRVTKQEPQGAESVW